jgi:hypothetical protein
MTDAIGGMRQHISHWHTTKTATGNPAADA